MTLVLRLLALLAPLSLFAIAGSAAAQPIVMLAPPPPLVETRTEAEALAEDAAFYAAHFGVTQEAAVARLRAQQASVVETDRIAAAYRDRLAGITIEHVPAYRIVVHLTGAAPVADLALIVGDLTAPIVFRTGAAATRDAILAAIARHQAAIRADLIDPPGMGVDAATGTLALAVGADDADAESLTDIAARIAGIAQVPVTAFVPGRGTNLAIAGGEPLQSIDRIRHRVSRCTAGFLVTDGARTALATAAHCPDQLDIVDSDGILTTLPLIGAWGAGRQDVQLHAVPGSPAPLIHVDGAMRVVTGAGSRASLRTGDVVCHQGLRSGYSCAEVRHADYAPPGDLCAGPCPASWVMVDGPDCAHGDSGGPVLIGTTALGIVKGGSFRPDGSCSAYYVMSLGDLPSGWSLLTGASRQ